MAKNVLPKHWNGSEFEELHIVTKASNVFTNDNKSVQQKIDDFTSHLADYTLQVPYAEATGTANTYSATLNPAPTSLVNGLALAVKIPVDSTGTSTLNVNGLGAKTIKKANGSDVTNLKAGGIYTLRYDGVNFILQGEGASGNATASDLLLGKTATTDAGEITGTIPSKGAQIYTPTTSNQVIAAGQYLSGAQTIVGDANLIPANIKEGVSIFGKIGTLPTGKKFASGNVTSQHGTINFYDYKNTAFSSYNLIVSGLTFTPSIIEIYQEYDGVVSVYSNKMFGGGPFIPNYFANILRITVDGTPSATAIFARLDGTQAYVNGDGFRLPVTYGNMLFTWYAWE